MGKAGITFFLITALTYIGVNRPSFAAAVGSAEAAINAANELERQGKSPEAVRLLRRAYRKYGRSPVIGAALADLQLRAGNLDKATRLATRVHKKRPTYDWPLIILFKAHLAEGRVGEAGAMLRKLESLDTTANLDVLRGDLARREGKLDVADARYTDALRKDPQNSDLRRLRDWNRRTWMEAYIIQGQAEEASERLASLLQADAEKDVTLEALAASVLIAAGELKEAASKIMPLLEAAATEAHKEAVSNAASRLARSYAEKKKWKAALHWVARAEALHPSFETQLVRAEIARDQGDHDQAEKHYEKAVSDGGDLAYVHEARAWNSKLNGEMQGAAKSLNRAVKLEPLEPRYRVLRAIHRRDTGDLEGAISDLEAARSTCTVKENCDRFDNAYPRNFFQGTNAAGLALDDLGLPVAVTAELSYQRELSDVESLSRGLAVQGISEEQKELHLAPRLSPVIGEDIDVNVLASQRFPVRWRFFRLDKVGAEKGSDPSLPSLRQMLRAEVGADILIPGPGRLTVAPLAAWSKIDGHNVDNIKIVGTHFLRNEYIGGLRLATPHVGLWPFLEVEGSVGTLRDEAEGDPARTLHYRFKLYKTLPLMTSLNLESDGYQARYTNGVTQNRLASAATAMVGTPHTLLAAFGRYSLVESYESVISPQERSAGVLARVSTGGLRLSIQRLMLEASRSQWRADPSFYDHDTTTVELVYRAKFEQWRRFGASRPSLPDELPWTLAAGFTQHEFDRHKVVVAGEEAVPEALSSGSIRLTLFR